MDRRAIAISGIVQGVGFRPFVHGLASRLQLGGFIRNVDGGIRIEVEGDSQTLDRFVSALTESAPPLARIEAMHWSPRPVAGDRSFRIETSATDLDAPIFIPPDVATCDDCLAELLHPGDRRYRYPFLNCSHCGPRLTIIVGSPYDREKTSMASFAICETCRAEYENPLDRRFHAQPIACPKCGPQAQWLDASGHPAPAMVDPIRAAVSALNDGRIVAIKGLGGYHLAGLARLPETVAELRRRKHRDEKPFAVMVRDLNAGRWLCEISADEEALLQTPRRPIVLLRRRPTRAIAEAVAPGSPWLGLMLPYTPLHHLLMQDLGGQTLVMTSGNRSDEPIAHDDREAVERLSGIADAFLVHDRPIHLRCDDSVTRIVAGVELPIRRARGEAPRPIRLPIACDRPMLALGGQFKATFALGRGPHAFLSHHIGDLDQCSALRSYEESIVHYQRLFGVHPEVLVHDLHPDYSSTGYAERIAGDRPRIVVQHHHAHIAACLAENGVRGPVIGLAFDGTGYGSDGTIWGGEFLVADLMEFRRAAHFRPVALPGGDRAIYEPWRVAASYLIDAGKDPSILGDDLAPAAIKAVARMVERRWNTPMTSSAGRLFDAVSAIAGVRRRVSHEGQAAVELEWRAAESDESESYPFGVGPGEAPETSWILDFRPTIHAIVEDVRLGIKVGRIARRFHCMLIDAILEICVRLREETGIGSVAISGGVFLNAILSAGAIARLESAGFRVYRHRLVPPNDGGLALGQLAIAAARLRNEGG